MGDVPKELRYISTTPSALASGKPLALGTVVKASDLTYGEDRNVVADDQWLLDDGLLVDATPVPAEEANPPLEGKALDEALEQRGILEGNKSKSADEKRDLVAEHDAAQEA